MTVYIVTAGEYSDYGISSVFSTKELAETYANEFNKIHPYESPTSVEEWEVDQDVEIRCVKTWVCRLDLKTGDCYTEHEGVGLARPGRKGYVVRYGLQGKDADVAATSYESAAHARKLAIEDRQAYLREVTEPK